jgi:hypothetical protein
MQLKWLKITFGVETKNVDVSIPGFQEIEFHLPELGPQKSQDLVLTALFLNSENIQSSSAISSVKVVDPRPPPAYSTGIGLFWTSPPGPSKEVELKLAWNAPADSLYRVYLTDQHGLGLAPDDLVEPVPQAIPSRARVAQVGCKKILDHNPVSPKAFRLLTEEPIKAGNNNRAEFTTRLPRSLETVQFLRVVPLSAEGSETPFDKCGIVPVAVPESRRPLPPKIVDSKVDTETGSTQFEVIADGFDLVNLERDERGLFTSGAPGDRPPQFRIRRAVGPMVDPIYARTIFEGLLTLKRKAVRDTENVTHTEIFFSSFFKDDNNGDGLKPFVRYVYWAEVRLPLERRVPAGVTPLDPIDGVYAVDPVSGSDYPRPISLPSAPHTLMYTPSSNPDAPSAGDINTTRTPPDGMGNIEIVIELANPPQVHPKAIGPYRLAVWSQWPGHSIEPVKIPTLDGTWPEIIEGLVPITVKLPPGLPSTSPLDLRLAIVDPVGRMSSITTLTVL